MEPIRNFDQLTSHLKTLNKRKRIAVVCANDPNTEYAIARALDEGIAEFLMIGDIPNMCRRCILKTRMKRRAKRCASCVRAVRIF